MPRGDAQKQWAAELDMLRNNPHADKHRIAFLRHKLGVTRRRKHGNLDKPHCEKGHKFTPKNTIVVKICRRCKQERERGYRRKKNVS